jgi:golgi SNAP receptor complex member 1
VIYLNGDAEAVQRRGTSASSTGKDIVAVDHMTSEMEGLLGRLQNVVDAMSSSLQLAASPPPALTHTLKRHTEILHDYVQEFRKTRGSVASVRERANLLSGARSSSEAARLQAAITSAPNGVAAASFEALYEERAALSGASVGADAAIQTGLNLREDLERQRATFASMVQRMESMSEGMPAVNRLIVQIRRKKKRDVLIIAGVIALLLVITFCWRML